MFQDVEIRFSALLCTAFHPKSLWASSDFATRFAGSPGRRATYSTGKSTPVISLALSAISFTLIPLPVPRFTVRLFLFFSRYPADARWPVARSVTLL